MPRRGGCHECWFEGSDVYLGSWAGLGTSVFTFRGGLPLALLPMRGGSATTKRPGSSAGRDPGRKKEPSTSTTLPVPLLAYEDNQSTLVVLEKGYSAKLTHISRTHTGSSGKNARW